MYNYITRTGPYSVFGTASSLKALTASYVADTNGIQLMDSLRSLQIEVSFTPGTNGEFCEVRVETSDDEGFGSPTLFYFFSENNYPDAAPIATNLGVEGVPYRFPADVAAPVAATNYKRSYQISNMGGARWVRISARSTVGSSFGTAFIRVRMSE
jgi:hypothetical protein